MHWALNGDGADDPALPEGVRPLSDVVQGPDALKRRLAQIGIVARDDGAALRARLRPGQRLVSREGDLWRWDGFTAAADAPSAAARRLAEKNRLGDLERDAAEARAIADRERAEAESAQAAVRAAASAESAALEAARGARRAFDLARERLIAAERREADAAARRSALHEAAERLAANEAEARERRAQAEHALADLGHAPALEARLLELRAAVAERRGEASEARAALQTLIREAEMAARRRDAIAAEIRLWSERAERAGAAVEEYTARLARLQGERKSLAEMPDAFILRRRALMAEVEDAEGRRRDAADRLAEAETGLAEADRAARDALEALSAAREARAGSQARFEAATRRLAEITRSIADNLETTPAGLAELAGLKADAPLPDLTQVETRLGNLKGERERLGAVNLRAEEELAEIDAKRTTLIGERDDLVEAIKRLRQAIGSLNREGRERLLAAFDVVNEHFRRLFTTLFGGGTAELTLVDSDDPLEAGLEILASPRARSRRR